MAKSTIFWLEKLPSKVASAVAFFRASECLLFSSFARSALLTCYVLSPVGLQVSGGFPLSVNALSVGLFELLAGVGKHLIWKANNAWTLKLLPTYWNARPLWMSFIGNRTFGTFGRLSTSFLGELALLVCPKSPTLMLSQEVLHPLLAQFMGKNLHPLVLLPWNWIQRRQTPPDPLSAWWEQFVIWEIF